MNGDVYIFAGGGTGGHLYPALAVAESLRRLQPDSRVVFACSTREIDQRILSATEYAFVPQPVRPLPRRVRGWGSFVRGWWGGRRLARRLVRDIQPAGVLGLGGYAAVPVVSAAAGEGVPVGLLCIDAVPGLANRHLARRAEVIFTQFQRTAGPLGRQRRKVREVGCPVRQALVSGDAREGRAFFGLREGLKTLLVAAGSLGAANINEAVAAIRPDLDALAGEWQVVHVTGVGKGDEVRTAYRAGRIHHAVLEFCERMDLAYAVADLALCRAGASTVAELSATGTPAVLMPYPYHRDRQQYWNAEPLASAGAAEIVLDAADRDRNAEGLRRVLPAILRDPVRLAAMRRAAAARSRPRAADAVAGWLAGLKPKP